MIKFNTFPPEQPDHVALTEFGRQFLVDNAASKQRTHDFAFAVGSILAANMKITDRGRISDIAAHLSEAIPEHLVSSEYSTRRLFLIGVDSGCRAFEDAEQTIGANT